MKFIAKQTKEIGFVHEDGFEVFLKNNNIEYKKVTDIEVYEFGANGGNEYTFFEYEKKDKQRVLACSTFVNMVDEFFEEIILFQLDDEEVYKIEEAKRAIREVNKE